MSAHLLRESALADMAGLTARHPDIFRPASSRRAVGIAGVIVAVGLFVFGIVTLDVSWTRVLSGFGRLLDFAVLMVPPEYGTTARLLLYLRALAETLAIAFLGTILAAIIAVPLGLLAASNVVASVMLRFTVRRGLDTVRGLDKLIWALIWIKVVGLGPFAGILAIMTTDIGIFGKLFSEAIEAADTRPGEGVASTGGSGLHGVRFGLLPGVLPVLASQVLYQIESNTRSATIIGIVGAGGIGLHLSEQIRTLEWGHVSFLILIVLVAVALIDLVSSRLRFAIIGRAPGRG